MVKPKASDSGSGSHLRSKRKDKLEKNLKRVRDSTEGLTCGSKTQSSAHDNQTTKRRKNKETIKTSADHSSLIETAEKKVSEGSSSKKVDSVVPKSGIAHDRSKDLQKYKSTNEKISSDTYSKNSPRISIIVPAQKDNDEASSFSHQPSSVQRHIHVVKNPIADSKTEMLPQTDSALKNEKRIQHRRRKRSKRKSGNLQRDENIKENEDPNAKDSCGVNVEVASHSENTCLDKSSNRKRNISSHVAKYHDEIDNSTVSYTSDTLLHCSTKKLIILDLNGLLVDIQRVLPGVVYTEHRKLGRNLVLKRPYCDDFLNFCFERFHVGIWTSRKRYNADLVIDHLMRNLPHKLLFCWDASQCTETGEKTVDSERKPLVLKEIKKLWNKAHDLPWEKGVFSESNTLLIDDSPYKCICNPAHTAIFPWPYNYKDKDDRFLGPGGELRVYLKQIAVADDVQAYVREHPFGQKPISSDHPSWNFYQRIINRFQNSSSSKNTRRRRLRRLRRQS